MVQKSQANHHEKLIKQQESQPKNDPQIPQPDLRFATKQNSEATKKGAGPNKNQHKNFSDLPWIQRPEPLYHHQKHAN